MTDATRTSTATTSRRTLLRFAAAGGATVAISGATGAPWAGAAPRKAQRVYVLVTDGLRPDEISADCTPTLHALRDKGTWYPNARSLPLMETLPNHVMMMTGVRPDRSGVPANKIYDPAAGEVRDMDRPSDITVPTTSTASSATGRPTAGSPSRSCRSPTTRRTATPTTRS